MTISNATRAATTSVSLPVRRRFEAYHEHITHCLSVVLVSGIWVWQFEQDHLEHKAHLKAENDGKLPQPPAYEYLNIRRMCHACFGRSTDSYTMKQIAPSPGA